MTEECYAGSDNTDRYVATETRHQTYIRFTNQVLVFTEFLPIPISINIKCEPRRHNGIWISNVVTILLKVLTQLGAE